MCPSDALASPSDDLESPPAAPVLAVATLRVRDLAGMSDFYTGALALEVLPCLACDGDSEVVLGRFGVPLVHLVSDPEAPDGDSPFRIGLRFEDLGALAATAYRAMRDPRTRIVDATDLLVARVITLRDPEGNGIDLTVERPVYCDGPVVRAERPIAVKPMDLGAFLVDHVERRALDRAAHLPAHLGAITVPVPSLHQAGSFYLDALDMRVTSASLPGALMLSAGHNARDLTVRVGEGTAAMRRLADVRIVLSCQGDLERAARRFAERGLPTRRGERSEVMATSPSGTQLTLALEAGHVDR